MDTRVSVALAAYNSEKYIIPQIDSILFQLKDYDELVISYNESTDRTWEIINQYSKRDSRVKIVKCLEKGLVPNFESAIRNTSGKYIFLSDHDDVWVDDKIDKVLLAFENTKCILVLHGRYVTDADLKIEQIVDYKTVKTGAINNIIKNQYCGSCMAFKKELIDIFCPIPRGKIMHDMWIGILASLNGKITVINDPLIYYRRHGDNLSVSKRRKLTEIIHERLYFSYVLFSRRLHRGRN